MHRRDQLIDVAAKLFSERGYHGTSMQDLAEALGILRGSIYAHISSKEDILFEIVDRGAERFISRLDLIAASGDPADIKITKAITAHIETVTEHLDVATVFLNDWKFLSGPRRAAIAAKRDRYEQLLRQVIADGIRSKHFRKGLDPKFAALQLLSAMNWTYQWYHPGGPLSAKQIGNKMADSILNGFLENGAARKGEHR